MMTNGKQAPRTTRSEALFLERLHEVQSNMSRVFGTLLIAQWVAAIALAIWLLPLSWVGTSSAINVHLWAATVGGGLIISLPVYLAFCHPQWALTHNCVAIAQMLLGAMLIHLNHGHIETHFHVFVSLAFLAMYRDWRLLVIATVVTGLDHVVGGYWWPRAVFGISGGAEWLWVEHVSWVLFEDVILIWACQRGLKEMREIAFSQTEQSRQGEQLRRLLESSVQGIYGIDNDGRCTFINRVGSELLGFSVDEVLGKNIHDLIHAPRAKGLTVAFEDSPINRALQNGKGCRVSGEILWRKDGSCFPSDYSSDPLTDGDVIQGAVITFSDIRERLHAEEKACKAQVAEQTERTRREFLANMSHELRTPLNSVIGFANILLKNKAGSLADKDITYLNRILDNGKHLLNLINQVLDLTKVESGRMDIDLVAVNLKQLVQETVAQLEGNISNSNVQLRADIPDNLKPLRSDVVKLKQVLINLVGNALKFTEKGSVTVRVVARLDNNQPIAIDVIDTGIGIPADKVTRVFEAFQQGDNTTSRKYGGTGLGLTIARSLCDLLGYRIEVTSEPGVGSTFRILLDRTGTDPSDFLQPVQGESALCLLQSVQQTAASSIDFSRKVVLVIDDEADARTLLMHYFDDCGCQVLTAKSGMDGLRMAREFRPSLITLDLMMPGLDGFQVLSELKRDPDLRKIPVLVVSIVASERRGSLLGAVDVLDKPVSRESLQNLLTRHLHAGQDKELVTEKTPFDNTVTKNSDGDTLDIRMAHNHQDAMRLPDDNCPDVILLDVRAPDEVDFLELFRNRGKSPTSCVMVTTAADLTLSQSEHLRTVITAGLKKEGHFVPNVAQRANQT